MLAIPDMRIIASARLAEAAALLAAGHYDGAVYLSGYAVELALKARICRTLRWDGYPENKKEFERLQSFRIHDLYTLLHLTGRRNYIKGRYVKEWTIISIWTPEVRYVRIGTYSAAQAQQMISAAEKLSLGL